MISGPKPTNTLPDESDRTVQPLKNLRHIYELIGDQLDDILADINLPLLDPSATLDQETISRLAMVTAFQYAESLSDGLAMDAMRNCMDWKYALHLPVHHQGFAPETFCGFRQNLRSSQRGLDEFARLLEKLGQIGLYARATRNQMTPWMVLTTVCLISRLHRVSIATKASLGLLVAIAPDWIRANMPPYWLQRYKTGRLYLPAQPNCENMTEEANQYGTDMLRLINAFGELDPALLAGQPEVEYLTNLFKNQFTLEEGQVHWRKPGCEHCPINDLKKNYT